jgi:dipeptidyl aminopeptidase/acylaminoacyl peptidase
VSRNELPFGTWPSAITPAMLTAGAVKLLDVWTDTERDDPVDRSIVTVWHEGRPAEGGRQPLVTLDPDGVRRDVLAAPFSARSAVHEYGGGAAWVEDGIAWFVNWDDQRIWRVPVDGSSGPVPLTPEPDTPRGIRYADLRRSPDGAWLVAVRERHSASDPHEVVNDVVVLRAHEPSEPLVAAAGPDFVMSPRFTAADEIRFIAWNHPDMPWNDTSLVQSAFDPDTGTTGEAVVLAGGASFMQPVGDVVISDRSGWWNLWRITADGETPCWPSASEIGGPAWNFGFRDHDVTHDGRHVWSSDGGLVVDGVVHDVGAAAIEQLSITGSTVTAIVRSADRPAAIVRYDLDDPSHAEIVVAPDPVPIDAADVSLPERVEFPTAGGAVAHGWFYPPASATVKAPAGELPPLVTMIHGGPTSCARPWFSLATQFWTNRGFAVVDVDHRGSSGYGTEYRSLLDGNWGVVDVEDCTAAASWLADVGRVDRQRMVIRGGSAGGFTVLACLAFGDVFAAGACSYGIADLSVLAAGTHKFEARYTDRLIGPWPEARAVYEARSPIHHLDRFDRPLIVFQGLDDRVVPPNQSEMIVAALRARGVECEYHAYEGEGHGFRRAETIEHQLTSELAFYQRVLGLG